MKNDYEMKQKKMLNFAAQSIEFPHTCFMSFLESKAKCAKAKKTYTRGEGINKKKRRDR